jgi:hypothetical protein
MKLSGILQRASMTLNTEFDEILFRQKVSVFEKHGDFEATLSGRQDHSDLDLQNLSRGHRDLQHTSERERSTQPFGSYGRSKF